MVPREIPEKIEREKGKMPRVDVNKPENLTLNDYVGKPVIIEPLKLADKQPNWNTAPWQVLIWSDRGNNTWEASESLVFAKAIVAACEAASKVQGGYIAGIVAKEGSQFWVDSSNQLITDMLDKQYQEISGK